jgi:hypothetical protein
VLLPPLAAAPLAAGPRGVSPPYIMYPFLINTGIKFLSSNSWGYIFIAGQGSQAYFRMLV